MRRPTRPPPPLDPSGDKVEVGDFDFYAQVIDGPHKGVVGFVDDYDVDEQWDESNEEEWDEDLPDEAFVAMLYPGVLYADDYVCIPYKELRKATPGQTQWFKSQFENDLVDKRAWKEKLSDQS